MTSFLKAFLENRMGVPSSRVVNKSHGSSIRATTDHTTSSRRAAHPHGTSIAAARSVSAAASAADASLLLLLLHDAAIVTAVLQSHSSGHAVY